MNLHARKRRRYVRKMRTPCAAIPDNGDTDQLDMDETQKVDEDTSSNCGNASAGTTCASSPRKHKRVLSRGSLSPSHHGQCSGQRGKSWSWLWSPEKERRGLTRLG